MAWAKGAVGLGPGTVGGLAWVGALVAIAPVCVPTLSVIATVPKPVVAGPLVSTVSVKAGVLSALSLPAASVVLTCNVCAPSPKLPVGVTLQVPSGLTTALPTKVAGLVPGS